MTQEQIQEMHKRFDDVVFSIEQDLLGNDIKVLNAEHLGDVQSKIIPRIKEFVQEELDKAVKEERETIARLIQARIGTVTRNQFMTEKEMGNIALSAEAQHARVEAYRDTLYIIKNK